MAHINWHVYICVSVSQRLVPFIQTPGKRQSVRVRPCSGPSASPVHRLPSYITRVRPAPATTLHNTVAVKMRLRLWIQQNSVFFFRGWRPQRVQGDSGLSEF